MNKLFELIWDLFSSRSLTKRSFSSIRSKIALWGSSGTYPLYADIPDVITFPYEFWQRISEIYRHTIKDMHERAVRVWWADGEFVLTDSVRGSEKDVVIPKQTVTVRFEPVTGTDRFERIINVDTEVYSKKTMQGADVARIQRVEVSFLFNMHTHPPSPADSSGSRTYSFFSAVDVRSFMATSAAVTGLVTDRMWLLIKTNRTPAVSGLELDDSVITPDYLRERLFLKVYCAEFGKSVAVVQSRYGEDVSSPHTGL